MDYVKVYQQAWGLWKEKRFVEAEEYLYSFWRQSEIRTLRGMLLLAYIFRDEQRYVSEIRQLEEHFSAKIQLISFRRIEISSSEIRARRSEGLSVRYLVPEAVREYMEEKGLYLDE